jgi:hypothetical protein
MFHIDNQGTIALASNPTFHACTKHIGVQHHFICEHIEDNDITLDYILMNNQVADVLTKALVHEKHAKFHTAMGLHE